MALLYGSLRIDSFAEMLLNGLMEKQEDAVNPIETEFYEFTLAQKRCLNWPVCIRNRQTIVT